MTFVTKNIDELTRATYNPRIALKKGDKEYEKIKNSIMEFGLVEPIVWNKRTGHIVGGHQRLTVLEDMGVKEVECTVIDTDEKREKALNIALNKITGKWDESKLSLLIKNLSDKDFDVSLTGIDKKEIDELMSNMFKSELSDDNFDIDSELQKKPFTRIGDKWILGRHTLVCGDSANESIVSDLCSDNKIDLYLTDPPYNVAVGTKERGKVRAILNDDMSSDEFLLFLQKAFKSADSVMKDGAMFYIWHGDSEGLNFRKACLDNNWHLEMCLIWLKDHMVIGRQDYQWIHEPCLYGCKGKSGMWYSDGTESSLLEFPRPIKSDEHPTMKPLSLIGYLIQNSSKEGDNILDSFGGSGTTLIASERLNRNCYMIELDPKYVDVIVNRYKELKNGTSDIKCIRQEKEYTYDEIQRMANDDI